MEDALLYSYMSNLLDSTGKGKGSNSLKRKGGAPKGTAGGKKRKTAETKMSKAKPRKAISKKDKGKNAAKVDKPKNKATVRMTVSKKGNTQATMSKQKNGAVSKKVTGKNQDKVGEQKKGTKKIPAKAAKPAKKQVSWVLKEGVAKDELLEALANDISDKWTNLGRRLNIEQSKLQAMSKDFDSVHERAFQMLKHWKQKQGSGASYKSLSTALKHNLVERKDLAEKYCFKRQ